MPRAPLQCDMKTTRETPLQRLRAVMPTKPLAPASKEGSSCTAMRSSGDSLKGDSETPAFLATIATTTSPATTPAPLPPIQLRPTMLATPSDTAMKPAESSSPEKQATRVKTRKKAKKSKKSKNMQKVTAAAVPSSAKKSLKSTPMSPLIQAEPNLWTDSATSTDLETTGSLSDPLVGLRKSPDFPGALSPTDVIDPAEKLDGSSTQKFNRVMKEVDVAVATTSFLRQRVAQLSRIMLQLTASWEELSRQDMTAFGTAVLKCVFKYEPSYQLLFYHSNLKQVAKRIMDVFGRVVIAFTKPVDMLDVLNELGARHRLYAVGEPHYTAMRRGFFEVLPDYISEKTHRHSLKAWAMFWTTFIELAVKGGNTPRGDVFGHRCRITFLKRVQSVMKELVPRQQINGIHRLFYETFQRASAKHAELASMQYLNDERVAHRVTEALIVISKNLSDDENVVTNAQRIAAQTLFADVTNSITEEVLKMLEQPFVDACASFLEPQGQWNIFKASIMQQLWADISRGFLLSQRQAIMNSNSSAAPSGVEPFCIIFTDIESSTQLWNSNPAVMAHAVVRHHKIVRDIIGDFDGYEVKTVGDSFLIATHLPMTSLLIALCIQLEMMSGPIAENFVMLKKTQGGGAAAYWRDDTIRVRIGIHYCTNANAVYDKVHQRYDYYGPSINCASRVESTAGGGQILVTESFLKKLQEAPEFHATAAPELYIQSLNRFHAAQQRRQCDLSLESSMFVSSASQTSEAQSNADARHRSLRMKPTLQQLVSISDYGVHQLKGIEEPEHLFSILPAGLRGRVFSCSKEDDESARQRRHRRHESDSDSSDYSEEDEEDEEETDEESEEDEEEEDEEEEGDEDG